MKTYFLNLLFLVSLFFLIFGCSEIQSNNSNTIKSESIRKSDSTNQILEKSKRGDFLKEKISETKKNYKISEGKPDTLVIEFDENNKLLIPGMGQGAFVEENSAPWMYKKYTFVQEYDTIEFTFSSVELEGDIRGNELFFEINKDFHIKSILCNAQAGVFFNEDGSGGVWEEFQGERFENYPANQIDEYIYEVPVFEGIEDAFSDEIITKADKKTEENELLYYDFMISEVSVEINYSLKGKIFKKTILFKYEYGD